jgi:hypothetical protein
MYQTLQLKSFSSSRKSSPPFLPPNIQLDRIPMLILCGRQMRVSSSVLTPTIIHTIRQIIVNVKLKFFAAVVPSPRLTQAYVVPVNTAVAMAKKQNMTLFGIPSKLSKA